MKNENITLKASYIFIALAFLLLVGSLLIHNKVDDVRNTINVINYKSNIEHVINLSDNIKDKILSITGDNIYKSLKSDINLREELEKDLGYFISNKYKDIYVLDKVSVNNQDFRVLLDSTRDIDEKFYFEELYRPDHIEKYNEVYKTKQATTIQNRDIKSLWMTNVYPIIVADEIKAVLVVDFSVKELNIVISSLHELDDIFKNTIIFFLFTFIVIIYFSYIDVKREKLKQKAHKELELKTDELEIESNKVKTLNEELQSNITKLKRAIEVKSDFLANMSHEIRTPLNGILGFVDILKDNVTDVENKKYLTIIDSSSHHLLGVINDILDLSKMENGKLEIENIDFNVKDELQSTINLFQAKASENNLSLKINFDNNLPENLVGDVLRIKQVVSNLLSNAIKFTPNNKSVYLDISYNANLLNVNIKDEGIGIAEDEISHIFEAFSQADSSITRKYGGTGLGLSISNTIISLMNGELKLKSEVGVGSEFYFSIPLSIAKERKKPIFKDINQVLEGYILVVEDNKSNQLFMKVLLKKLNLKFDIVNDGLESIEAIKNKKYDAILMDENMPNMNGIEATRIILNIEKEKNLVHTPIIALTANALKGDKKRFLEAGMDEYLAKPISKTKLDNILSKYLRVNKNLL